MMERQFKQILMIFAVFTCVLWSGQVARAVAADVYVTVGTTAEISVNIGDTGRILPSAENLTDALGQPVTVSRWEYKKYDDDWGNGKEEVIRVDEMGNYIAVSNGTVTYVIYGYAPDGTIAFTGYCRFTVTLDMTNVTLATKRLTGYITGDGIYSAEIAINSQVVLTEDNSTIDTSDDSEMDISCRIENNKLLVSVYSEGSTSLTVTINGKSFVIHIKVAKVEMSKTGLTTAKGKTVTLRIKGTGDKAVWSSSNPSVAKVSGNGSVRCKKTGNAVITAKLGDVKLGCAVSVVSPGLLKTVNTAKKIGANWKYSQPKRMQKGYYDCSSLVWKSYKKIKKMFGGRSYAPVAADIAKWCANHKKMVTNSYTWKQVQNMKLRPGDLLFKTGENNGRYKGIYHVEMFVGYSVSYFDESGKPVLSEMWAARPVGYGGGGYPIARP